MWLRDVGWDRVERPRPSDPNIIDDELSRPSTNLHVFQTQFLRLSAGSRSQGHNSSAAGWELPLAQPCGSVPVAMRNGGGAPKS